jgi:hypothetical protein
MPILFVEDGGISPRAVPRRHERDTNMADGFSALEQNILKAKGVDADQMAALVAAGISSRNDFATIGDASTLREVVPGLSTEVADNVMQWAIGATATTGASSTAGVASGGRVVLDTSDAVYCVHCQAKQPKDYKSGDLCVNCGKQAEPTESCYWCASSGPGRFCRNCGATFVPTAELDLAILLRRDGLSKDDIPKRLAGLSPSDKDALWGRVRHARG